MYIFQVKALHGCKTKHDLQHELRVLMIEKLMTDDENLKELKEKLLQLERFLFKPSRIVPTTAEDELDERICEVVIWLCTVLDRSVMRIKNGLYKDEGTESYNLQFPRPSSKDLKYEDSLPRDKLIKFFEKKWKWVGFSENHLELFEFFFKRLNIESYPLLTKIFIIRNKTGHREREEKIGSLNDYYQTEKDKIQLARDASEYAAEVWNFIKSEVDQKFTQTAALETSEAAN